jgi:alpha-methylacyl-CoA racemase
MLPLKGIRIVSLALNLPGPAALMRCRAMGATCVKVEPLNASGGDPLKTYNEAAYAQMHQGVRTLVLDLKTGQGQAKLDAELSKADVLLTSFRPSALKRLGLDWTSLHKRHPKLWQVAIVGGEGEAAEIAGHDLTYLAQNDLVTGLDLPATLFADMTGSLLAVEAILGVALQIKMLAKPCRVWVSLSKAAQYAALPRHWGLTMPGGAVGGAHAGYQVYKCQDGRAAVAALEPHFAARLCAVAGLKTLDVAAMRRWFGKQTRESLEALAAAQDIPIYTMA